MKYPKLAAAIDEFLAKQVRDNGEDVLMSLLALATQPEPLLEPPPVVEFKQTEVRE